jgi:hypothetical protein
MHAKATATASARRLDSIERFLSVDCLPVSYGVAQWHASGWDQPAAGFCLSEEYMNTQPPDRRDDAGETEAICGAANARNLYGSYVGMKRLYVEFADGKAAEGGFGSAGEDRLVKVCGYSSSRDLSRSENDPRAACWAWVQRRPQPRRR